MQNIIWANRYKCLSIWHGYTTQSKFKVMLCHADPSVGVKQKAFKLQRDAIQWAKDNSCGLPVWVEKRNGFHKLT